jgi:hypothetical protein
MGCFEQIGVVGLGSARPWEMGRHGPKVTKGVEEDPRGQGEAAALIIRRGLQTVCQAAGSVVRHVTPASSASPAARTAS